MKAERKYGTSIFPIEKLKKRREEILKEWYESAIEEGLFDEELLEEIKNYGKGNK